MASNAQNATGAAKKDSSRDNELDRIAMQYLVLRGYSDVAKVLQAKAKLTDPVVPHIDRKEGLAQDLLFYNIARNDPEHYVQSYNRFASWVDNSLEQYRPDLARLLYPVCIYAYLDLVMRGATAQAHKLMTTAQRRFTQGQPQGKGRLQMLQDLASVSIPQQLRSNKTAIALTGTRFPVRISNAALQLALSYLQSARMMLLLNILNRHIKFIVVDAAPGSIASVEDTEADDTMYAAAVTGSDADTINRAVLQLQLLANNVEDDFAERQLHEEDAEAAAAAGAAGDQEQEGTKKARKEKKAQDRGREGRRAQLLELKNTRMTPQIPLPEPSEAVRAHIIEDMKHRADVSPNTLPCALMLTFLNTHQGLCCAATSEDAALVAGGFQDSSVRLYDLPALLNNQQQQQGGGAMDVDQPQRGGAGQGAPPNNDTDDEDEDNYQASSVSSCALYGHTDAVMAVDIAPGCELVLSGSVDGDVRLWSPEMQAGLVCFSGHVFPVWDVAFAPATPYYFASAGADRLARMWCTERLHPLRMFAGHQADVDVIQWHPNNHYIATGSSDRTIRLWDVASGKCVRLLTDHRAPVTALACSPDGKHLASGDAHGSVMLWDLGSARRVAAAAEHEGPVWSLAFSNGGTGSLLVSGGADHIVRVWDTAPGYASSSSANVVGKSTAALPSVASWQTRGVGVYSLDFTTRNIVVGAGAVAL